MKRYILIVILILLILCPKLNIKFNKNNGGVYSAMSKYELYDIDSYSFWLKNNIKYKNDKFKLFDNGWSTAEETLFNGYGDCEDFAFLSEKILKILGYYPVTLGLLLRRGGGHAICIFPYNGKWSFFDNNHLIITEYKSTDDFFDYINEIYPFYWIGEINNG